MSSNVKLGHDLIEALAPILGYEGLSSIRSVTLNMQHNEAAWMYIERFADGQAGALKVRDKQYGVNPAGKEIYRITVERVNQ